MPASNSIAVNLYKLNEDTLRQVLDDQDVLLFDIPDKLVKRYNVNKDGDDGQVSRAYKPMTDANKAKFSVDNKLKFYQKEQAVTVSHNWAGFFNKEGINLGNIQSSVPNIACFIELDGELYALTTGSASVVFEAYLDQSYPIELAKRIVDPALKGGKQQQISGAIQASDIYFRRPTRISAASSHQEVWKNLSGNISEMTRKSEEFTEVFGMRRSVSIEIKASIKISAKIDSPSAILKMLKWFKKVVDTELTDEQKSSFSFFDAIRPLTSRKDGVIINTLTEEVSKRILKKNADECDLSLSNQESSRFMNAETYRLMLNGETLGEWESNPPTLSTIADIINQNIINGQPYRWYLESYKFKASYEDQQYLNTQGTLFSHLSGELTYDDQTYYLLNGSWYQVDGVFQQISDDELKATINAGEKIALKHSDIALSTYSHSGEPAYNAAQVGDKKIVADGIFYKNLELADVLHYGTDGYLDIIHVKRELNGSIRDLVSQMRNAMDTIENDLNVTGQPVLSAYYESLKSQDVVNGLTKGQFINLFKKKRRYVFAYIHASELSDELVDKLTSSIAKNEIVSLIQYAKQLRERTSLHLVWIPKT